MKQPLTEDDRIWRALSDERRRGMLDLLAVEPRTTGDLVAAFDSLCRTAVMRHLEVLVEAKLVLVRWQGRVRWNYFNPIPIDQICSRWIDQRRSQMSSALRRLKEVVELPPETTESAETESVETESIEKKGTE